jgi:hypothetical protein
MAGGLHEVHHAPEETEALFGAMLPLRAKIL